MEHLYYEGALYVVELPLEITSVKCHKFGCEGDSTAFVNIPLTYIYCIS